MSLNKAKPQLKPNPIPEEHTKMLCILAKIPVAAENQKHLSWHQKSAWDIHKAKWFWIRQRIDYHQMLQLGYLPDDPFETVEWEHPEMREMLTLHGNLYNAILRVLIRGFPIVEEAASREGLDFPFNNPRELFAQICQEDAAFGASEVFGTDEKECLDKLRTNLSQESAFFRDRLKEKETNERLLALKEIGWSGFWQFAIWDNRFKKDLKADWEIFLKCHKSICRFINKENLRGNDVRIVIANWKNGVPLRPPYGHILDLGIVKKCTDGAVSPRKQL